MRIVSRITTTKGRSDATLHCCRITGKSPGSGGARLVLDAQENRACGALDNAKKLPGEEATGGLGYCSDRCLCALNEKAVGGIPCGSEWHSEGPWIRSIYFPGHRLVMPPDQLLCRFALTIPWGDR